MATCLIAALAVVASPALAQFQFGPRGTRFRSEPDIVRETINVIDITKDRSRLSPGYLFMAPRTYFEGWGPKIYDYDGMLIWDGNYTAGYISQNFQACDVGDKKGQHLCWHESGRLGEPAKGQALADMVDYNLILDNTYQRVGPPLTNHGTFESLPDAHEFNMVGGNNYMQDVMERKELDLTEWGGPKDGWIHDSCIQELRIDSLDPIFEWCYTDHLPITTSIYPKGPNQTRFSTGIAGKGIYFSPWDFFHINSVDKNEEGDYLLSGRHADEVMKLAGPNSPNGETGKPIWRLGGEMNQFKQDFNFTRQHHVRFVSTSATETVISIFDNTWEGEADFRSADSSSAKLVRVKNSTMEAELIQSYYHPYNRTSRAGGNAQVLPNGNMFAGWGGLREATEYSPEGDVLFHGVFKCAEPAPLINYRTFKFDWVGHPHFPPKLLAFSRSCGKTSAAPARLNAHVSWNGATEVVQWRFYRGYKSHGPWSSVGTYDKKSFETRVRISEGYFPFVRAEALDKHGKVIGSVVSATFVPTENALPYCDGDGFNYKPYMYYDAEYNSADLCDQGSSRIPFVVFIFLILGYEIICWVLNQTLLYQARDSSGAYAPIDGYKDDFANGKATELKERPSANNIRTSTDIERALADRERALAERERALADRERALAEHEIASMGIDRALEDTGKV